MKKYNMSQIMKDAWNLYRTAQKWVDTLSFSECLRRAWAKAKENAREFTGIVKNVQVAGTLAHPVLVNIDMTNLSVTGNTFPARQMFREFGLDWDKDSKAWIGTREQLTTMCRKYA